MLGCKGLRSCVNVCAWVRAATLLMPVSSTTYTRRLYSKIAMLRSTQQAQNGLASDLLLRCDLSLLARERSVLASSPAQPAPTAQSQCGSSFSSRHDLGAWSAGSGNLINARSHVGSHCTRALRTAAARTEHR